jgi:hypothetical protein
MKMKVMDNICWDICLECHVRLPQSLRRRVHTLAVRRWPSILDPSEILQHEPLTYLSLLPHGRSYPFLRDRICI